MPRYRHVDAFIVYEKKLSQHKNPVISEVNCPRKGPLGNIIAVTKCREMWEETPDKCVDCKCTIGSQIKKIDNIDDMDNTGTRSGTNSVGIPNDGRPSYYDGF